MPINLKDLETLSLRQEYTSIERELTSFLDFVPLREDLLGVYSPKLASVIYRAGPQIESILKNMTHSFGLDENPDKMTFPQLKGKLDLGGVLSIQKVITLQESIVLQPFADTVWWNEHNDLKHHYVSSQKKGTLRNALNMMAANFLLHWITACRTFDFDQHLRLLDTKNWHDVADAIRYGDDSMFEYRFKRDGAFIVHTIPRMKITSRLSEWLEVESQIFIPACYVDLYSQGKERGDVHV